MRRRAASSSARSRKRNARADSSSRERTGIACTRLMYRDKTALPSVAEVERQREVGREAEAGRRFMVAWRTHRCATHQPVSAHAVLCGERRAAAARALRVRVVELEAGAVETLD